MIRAPAIPRPAIRRYASAMDAPPLRFETLAGAALHPLLPELARLRIAVFRDWPYLYEGSADYEREYLATYVRSATSVCVLVRDGARVVGAATGIALADEAAATVAWSVLPKSAMPAMLGAVFSAS